MSELAGGATRAGEDRDTVAELMRVAQRQRLVSRGNTDHAEHGAEDLLAVDPHRARHAVEEGAAEVEARLLRDSVRAAIHHERRALGDAGLDVTTDAVAVCGSHERPHLGIAGGIRRSDAQCLHALGEAWHEGVGGLAADDDGDRDRHTTLARRTVGRAHQRIGHLCQVGVGEHDEMVLRAAH